MTAYHYSICRICRRISLSLGALLVILLAPSICAQTAPGADRVLDNSARNEVIDSILGAFKLHYLYPDTARAMADMVRSKLEKGEYDDIESLGGLTRRLTADMREFTRDFHIRISVMSPDDFHPSIGDTVTQDQIAGRARENFGFHRADRLPGNVGYLAFSRFDDPVYAGATAVSGLNFLANTDALIIDLRYNGGGEEKMVRLISSYFFREPVEINSLYFTETDSLEQSWTYAYVPGKKMIDTDLYILTSPGTASGAEAFSYGMQQRRRATIVGETTAGAAHWAEFYDFPELGVRAKIPIARPINPVSKTSWERVGVAPDIEVDSRKAPGTAYRTALEKLIEKAPDGRVRGELEWSLVVADTMIEACRLSRDELSTYTGVYGDGQFSVLFEQGRLCCRRAGDRSYVMIPLARDLFALDGVDDIRIRFAKDAKEKVNGLHLVFLHAGERPMIPRTGEI